MVAAKMVAPEGASMSALGQKQTYAAQNRMSALPLKADTASSMIEFFEQLVPDIRERNQSKAAENERNPQQAADQCKGECR